MYEASCFGTSNVFETDNEDELTHKKGTLRALFVGEQSRAIEQKLRT